MSDNNECNEFGIAETINNLWVSITISFQYFFNNFKQLIYGIRQSKPYKSIWLWFKIMRYILELCIKMNEL